MNIHKKKLKDRIRRHKRVRAKITGTKEVPRVVVFRSAQHVYAQVVDDQAGQTVLSTNDFKLKEPDKIKKSLQVGEILGEELKKKGMYKIIFDRGGFKYHGRVKALADGLRSAGIQF
ncbi:MAG: 50S ribosomal protein L18 [Candidatus Yanofskybacteria bacterium RIFCSPHIGHO2_02_FULL_43_15c]|uniref:Large ribosomal subunit protein uL18 n=2 Tax=Candidatus Yanofskyibacteriota TaxID=1752733 RepID=A0A1F8GZA8_9BACT|nr:MAG: 50S ribosomal protein L18 [Candidatus Yanofskybacteria bacterium RIFCSPHIGHO2_02_FULL_43_15c]OGN30763.1 MAG: 50S ribosomal protein L18 [Candidatus Yanofskybacteria bacterium RIFCSPLOWO2_02_FULL_43_10b]